MASGSTQVIVTLNTMDAPIALVTAAVSVAEAGITTATSTYQAATYVALYNVYHCISPDFYKNGQLIINGSTVIIGTNGGNITIVGPYVPNISIGGPYVPNIHINF